MKERPIIFSAPMVQAIIEGRKTQTRRVIKRNPFMRYETKDYYDETPIVSNGSVSWDTKYGYIDFTWTEKCPYGVPGDHLWIRETWGLHEPYPLAGEKIRLPEVDPSIDTNLFAYWKHRVRYKADGATAKNGYELGLLEQTWRPSIFMPRWISRILLEVTNIRAERVQSINSDDCVDEGIKYKAAPLPTGELWNTYKNYLTGEFTEYSARSSYSTLWNNLNEKRGYGWDKNPWVWVIEFKVIEVKA